MNSIKNHLLCVHNFFSTFESNVDPGQLHVASHQTADQDPHFVMHMITLLD